MTAVVFNNEIITVSFVFCSTREKKWHVLPFLSILKKKTKDWKVTTDTKRLCPLRLVESEKVPNSFLSRVIQHGHDLFFLRR
jgi:hypothetical protein